MTTAVALLAVPYSALASFFTAFHSVDKLDLGPAIIYHGSHPVAGDCTVIMTTEETGAILLNPDRQVSVESLLGL